MKDIKVVDLRALGKNEEPYAIVCSGFSGRHCHQTAKTLVKELKGLDCTEIINKPTVGGKRSESWFLVTVKHVMVHMVVHEYREELDLEFRWMNKPPPEMQKKWALYRQMKKKSVNLHVDEKTFAIKNKQEAEWFEKKDFEGPEKGENM